MSPGLDKLSRSILEALPIEVCSICLQKLEETVLLWPCAHWFCHGCIKKLHLSKSGKKVMCPLCNGATTRRSILEFEDKQKEYQDHLQTLIGAVSLDLGFDVTSYTTNQNSEVTDSKNSYLTKDISPVRKTKIKTADETKALNQGSKRATRSKNSNSNKMSDIARPSTSCKPPETPKHYKEKKVEDWLKTTRFSIGEQDSLNETHQETSKTDLATPTFSEEQLKSVSQIEFDDIIQTSSAKNEKMKQNRFMKPQTKKSNTPLNDQFDELLLKEHKSRFITSTYGNSSNRKSRGKLRVIDSDIFNTTEGSKNQSGIKKLSDKSESTFEDFSSGSGEEWCLSKKKRVSILKKSRIYLKGKKSPTDSWKNTKIPNVKSMKKSCFVSKEEKETRKNTFNLTDTGSVNRNLKSNSSKEKNNDKEKSKCELKGIEQSVKEIINDWDNSDEIDCKTTDSKQVTRECNVICTPMRDPRMKNSNLPSPGWSRLTRTKKEFNVSEKKKLSLNKTNTSETTPLLETSKPSAKITDETSPTNKQDELPTSKVGLEVNHSFSSAACTPFKGFEVPTMNKKRDRDSGICNESRHSSPERKRICRDVEVQTTPSRMQACIKDYLRETLGEDVEHLLSKDLKGVFNKLQNISSPKKIVYHNVDIDQNQDDNIIHRSICSQDSDKENVIVPFKNAINTDGCLDSDFILGTEDTKTLNEKKKNQFDFQNPKLRTNIDENMIVEAISEVDPDAVTQPYYKTPVVPKQTLKTSTQQLYSAVSNPSESELKKVSDIFLKHDSIDLGVTPVSTNSWNDSGVVQLEKSSGKGNKVEDRQSMDSKSLESKEKKNRSRRQLYFADDSKSNDTDMFEATPPEKISRHFIEQTNAHGDKDHFTEEEEHLHFNEVEVNHNNINSCENQVIHSDNVKDNTIEEVNREVSAETSEDFFVEGTPDIVQKNVHQEEDITEEGDIQFVHTQRSTKKNDTTAVSKATDILKETYEEPEKEQRLMDNVCSLNTAACNSSLNLPPKSSKNYDEEFHLSCLRSEDGKTRSHSNFEIYTEENSELTENTEDVDSINYCFASSLLTGDQNLMLLKVLNGLNIPYSKTVGEHISHLIVSTTNGCTKNTYKVLYAMALHKPIIRFEWVEHVLRTGRTSVSLDPFIALDPSGECGVVRARKDKKRNLLHQFAIHVYNVIESVIRKEQIEELVRLCGGTVVSTLHQFQAVPRHMYRIIILSEPPETCTQGEWRQKYAAAEVSVDWLYNTIGRYKVVPVASYMVEQTNSVQFLLHEGYPENLIFDTSLQNDSTVFS